MITITERATQAIQRARDDRHVPDEQGVRLAPDGTGTLRLVFDTPRARDLVVRNGDAPLLILEASIADRLDHAVLDYADSDGDGSPQFTLIRRSMEDGAVADEP
jgi:Fe-S cluster assembly iron-binding protein IscA